MMEIKGGYIQDFTGASTRKVMIVDETPTKYVCRKAPFLVNDYYGKPYYTFGIDGIFLRDKSQFTDIHTETLEVE